MLPEYKTKTNMGIGLGIVLQIVGRVLSGNPDTVAIASIILLAGAVSMIYGCCCYAKAKGHSPAFGLLGLLSIIGLIILVIMPDKHKDA